MGIRKGGPFFRRNWPQFILFSARPSVRAREGGEREGKGRGGKDISLNFREGEGRRRAQLGIKNAPSVLRSLLTFSPPPFLLSAFFARQSLGMGRKFGIFGKTTTTTLSFAKRERTEWKRETTLSQSHIYVVIFVSGLDIPGIFENYIFYSPWM